MMSVLNQSGEEQVECPLCLEPLEVDDLNFFPCTCGYQICRFCWHRIRTDENGLCPACRKAYSENPADFKPLSQEEVARLKAEKRQKDQQRKQKITENRKHLANIRVVQRNLVFVVGLPLRLADAEVLKKHEYFGKFGKIQKVVINQSTSYAGSQGPSASAYVTYHKADDALRAIQAVNNISVDGRTIKTSLGTTKYCSHFMKNQLCPKPDCMYLHELGDAEASFTKEEMQQGKHQEYEKKLHEQLLNTYNHTAVRDRKPAPSPPAVTSNIVNCHNIYQGTNSSISCSGTSPVANSTNCIQGSQSCSKEAWPSLQPGLTTGVSNVNFGLSGGTGNPNSSNNNINSNSTKGEGSQRRQRFDQQSAKSNNVHKKRHTSGEENRGKAKEKSQSNSQDELGSKSGHTKPYISQNLNARSHTESLSLSSNDLHQNVSSSNNSSSSSMSELTNGPTNEVDLEVQESDDNLVHVDSSCTMMGANGRQQLSGQNGGRMLGANHRAALFEPDNNSFFSTNNFTKVAATNSGSGSTDWPINGLTLTHMPDVLPPVHSSEDWQAAFGFTNSTNPPNSQNPENSCTVIPLENQQIRPGSSGLVSKVDSNNVDHDFNPDSQQQSQNFQNNLESKSSLSESVTVFSSPATSNISDEFRVNSSCTGHMAHKNGTDSGFILKEASSNVTIVDNSLPTLQNSMNTTSNSGANTRHILPQSSYVHQDGTVLMVHPQQYTVNNIVNNVTGSQHVITNGLQHIPNSSKFLTEFHLRQQNQNIMKHLNAQSQHLHNHSTIFECANLSSRNPVNVSNMNSVNCKFSMMGNPEFCAPVGKSGGECKIDGESELRNGGDTMDYISDERYLPGFLSHQQINLETNCELEYKNRDANFKILLNSSVENEDLPTKDSGKIMDDEELGFDPFHETQKALAEMMENENLVTMQSKQPTSHGIHNQHTMVNHLTQQLYQQCQLNQMNHVNHQLPPGSLFTNSKLLNSFNGRNQHVLTQQNHRLPPNISTCTKLLDGLGLGPSSASAMGPSAPTRTRLPPPGFTTAPNHMNAFGLGIPRAPSNNSSKILPFMGLGNSSNTSNNGASSPIPQTVPNLPNNIVHPQPGTNQPPIIFPSTGTHTNNNSHTFGLQNGIVNSGVPKSTGEPYTVKDWSENIRSLLPNLNSSSHGQNVQFLNTNTPPPPSLNAVFGTAPVHGSTQKGWSGIGPCTDWTALDPAIVSSSCQPNFLTVTSSNHHHQSLNHTTNPGLQHLHNANPLQQNKLSAEQQNSTSTTNTMTMPHLHQLQQNNTGHWLRSLPSDESMYYGSNILGGSPPDWAANANHSNGGTVQPRQNHVIGSPNSGSIVMASPPPGFSSMRRPGMQQGVVSAKKQTPVVSAEVRKIEISDANQTGNAILECNEEEILEGLR